MGSEDQLQFFFLRAFLFRRGQVEHVLTMANLKLKPSLFTLLIFHSLLSSVNVPLQNSV